MSLTQQEWQSSGKILGVADLIFEHALEYLARCFLQNSQHTTHCIILLCCFPVTCSMSPCLAGSQSSCKAPARSCHAVQAQEQLLLQLRDHLEAHPALTASHQRLRHQLQGETCMGSRLALMPQMLDILNAIPPATCIISLHMSQDGSVLYCAVLKGQQAGRTESAGKSKSSKQGRDEIKAKRRDD